MDDATVIVVALTISVAFLTTWSVVAEIVTCCSAFLSFQSCCAHSIEQQALENHEKADDGNQ
jgi:hypothetical protein